MSLHVSISEAITAQCSPPPSEPAKRAFLRLKAISRSFCPCRAGCCRSISLASAVRTAGASYDIDDDLSDQCPHKSLARPHRGSRHPPSRQEIIGQSSEVGTHIVGVGHLHSIEPTESMCKLASRTTPSACWSLSAPHRKARRS